MPAPSVYRGTPGSVNSDAGSSAPFHGHAVILTGTPLPPPMPAKLAFGRLQNDFGLTTDNNDPSPLLFRQPLEPPVPVAPIIASLEEGD